MSLSKLGEKARMIALTTASSLAAATAATAEDIETVLADGSRVIVREGCDTTGFPNQDGSFDSNSETRGAIFAPYRVVSGINPDGTAGRGCSVSMEVYNQMEGEGEGWDDDGTDTFGWDDDGTDTF